MDCGSCTDGSSTINMATEAIGTRHLGSEYLELRDYQRLGLEEERWMMMIVKLAAVISTVELRV